MFHVICNFIPLAGPEIEQQLDEEFQYQMEILQEQVLHFLMKILLL